MTFEQLCSLEPKLRELADEATAEYDDGTESSYCANAIWYGYFGHPGIKPRVCDLVGWGRKTGPAELRTSRAYDIAYQAIYDLLPNCRGACGCL